MALFMFEFRNPSSIIAVPEPASSLLVMRGMSLPGILRRRNQVA